MHPSGKISIIGAGSVGSAIAQSLLLRRVVADIILVDIDQTLCRAQVQDLSDATYLSNVRIISGTLSEAGRSDVAIITAGAKTRPGESRLDLIDRNLSVLRSVLDGMKPIREDTVLLIVANPVDVLTYFAQKLSGLPREQVLGSGTLLDSTRLRGILARKLQVADTAINAHVIGEHGDSQCVAWSSANISGAPLSSVLPLSEPERAEIANATRQKAYGITKAKGFTSYGIAAVTSSICESIVFDQRQVYPLSHWNGRLGCCLSLPSIVGRSGVISTVDMALNEQERASMEDSARSIKYVIAEYDCKIRQMEDNRRI